MPLPSTVVFVHGWSVLNTGTYGKLPERLAREARERGAPLDIRDIWLSRYVSFRDEVLVEDLSRGLRTAIERDLSDLLARGKRFACITHSTGGPVVRDWWSRFHLEPRGAPPCPMSHLVMLAPANFGSALAQLGKRRLSRLKAWFQGVEPGTGVLDWLELGSGEAWELNRRWISMPGSTMKDTGVFPFVLTGQTIDRRLYDHVNSYTGEAGSDGVVRVAAANLNATCVRLTQEEPRVQAGRALAPELVPSPAKYAPPTVFGILPGLSHSGAGKGILRSVRDDGRSHPTVDAVLACLEVETIRDYDALREKFAAGNARVQESEHVETDPRLLLPDTVILNDPHSLVIFRITDDRGGTIGDFDLKLTATSPADPGGRPSPDLLPKGFLRDRQRNSRHPGTLSFYLDADVMTGGPALPSPRDPGRVIRPELEGATTLGLIVEPHLTKGFVHFLPAEFGANASLLHRVVKPNQTTLVEIVMRRVVREGVFRLDRLKKRSDRDFTRQPEGDPIP